MQQIKAAATAASAANPSPAASKPPRAPLPFTRVDPTPSKPHTRPVADTHSAQSTPQQADTKAGKVDKRHGDALMARDALPSSTRLALSQDTGSGGKPAAASPALATASASASASAAVPDVASMQHQGGVASKEQAAAEELGNSERPEPTRGSSEKPSADGPGALPTSPVGGALAQRPNRDVRAEPSGPPVTVPTEGVKLDVSGGRAKKSSGEAEKKSSRDSKRSEGDRKSSRAKRRRSRSRSPSHGPKR